MKRVRLSTKNRLQNLRPESNLGLLRTASFVVALFGTLEKLSEDERLLLGTRVIE
jgi:hypothetical protein